MCTWLNCGSGLGLAMCTVWAVIQLSLAKNEAERIVLLLSLKINVCSRQGQHWNSLSRPHPLTYAVETYQRRLSERSCTEKLSQCKRLLRLRRGDPIFYHDGVFSISHSGRIINCTAQLFAQAYKTRRIALGPARRSAGDSASEGLVEESKVIKGRV